MHALVLYHSPWEPTRELAMLVATELGSRALAFDRRPELAMYDLVVLGTSGLGLLDPRLAPYLLGGAIRGKHLAVFSDVWPPPANAAFQATARILASVGGAHPTPEWLQVSTGPLGQVGGGERSAARVWARHLAQEFPPPAYPRE